MDRPHSFPWALALLVVTAGCGTDVPTFPRPVRDSGIECSEAVGVSSMDAAPEPMAAVGCSDGGVCVRGRCVPRCSADSDCATTEQCDTGRGLCVRRSTPRPDAGMPDAGFDPCAATMCGAGEVCHPVTGRCVQCVGDDCGGLTPICDRGYGRCVSFNPRPCAPCNNDRDCMDGAGTSFGPCVETGRASEKVCVPSCAGDAGTCPTGFECADGACLPHAISCTAYLSAIDARPCFMDEDCVPLGGTAAVGQCEGAMGPPDGGVAGRCLQPCGLPMHCPTGTTCPDMFCRPM